MKQDRHGSRWSRRWLALMLAVVMGISLLPSTGLAVEEPTAVETQEPVTEPLTQEPETEQPTQAPEPTTEPETSAPTQAEEPTEAETAAQPLTELPTEAPTEAEQPTRELPETAELTEDASQSALDAVEEDNTPTEAPSARLYALRYSATGGAGQGRLSVDGEAVDLSAGGLTIAEGRRTLKLTPPQGYAFQTIRVNGAEQTLSNAGQGEQTCTVQVRGDVSVAVTLQSCDYVVEITVPPMLLLKSEGAKTGLTNNEVFIARPEEGDVLRFTITGNPAYKQDPEDEDEESVDLTGYYEPTPESLGALTYDEETEQFVLEMTGENLMSHTIELQAQPVAYEVRFYDPLDNPPTDPETGETETYETKTYSCESEGDSIVTAPDIDPVHDGYTFLRWARADEEGRVNSDSEAFDLSAITKETREDIDLYAVYAVNGGFTLTGQCADGTDYAFGEGEWTNQSVQVTLALDNSDVDDYRITYQPGGETEVTAEGPVRVELPAPAGAVRQTGVTVRRADVERTVNEVVCTFSTPETVQAVRTVRQDTVLPAVTLERNDPATGSWENVADAPTAVQSEDGRVQYRLRVDDETERTQSGIREAVFVNCGSAALGAERDLPQYASEELTGWTAVPAGAFYNYEENGAWVMVVRVTDNAGNVRYLDSTGVLFDNDAPELSVRYRYTDGAGEDRALDNPIPENAVFSASDITAEITVRDGDLQFSDGDTAVVPVTVNGRDTEVALTRTVQRSDGAEVTCWVGTVTLDEPGRNTLALPAFADQAGNTSSAYTCEALYIDSPATITAAARGNAVTRGAGGQAKRMLRSAGGEAQRVYLRSGGTLDITAEAPVLTGSGFCAVVTEGETVLLDTQNGICLLTNAPAAPTVAEGTYTVTLTDADLSEGTHSIHAAFTNSAGASTERDYTVIVDKTAPAVEYQYTVTGNGPDGESAVSLARGNGLVTNGKVKVEVTVRDAFLWFDANDDDNITIRAEEPLSGESRVWTQSWTGGVWNEDKTAWTYTFIMAPEDYANSRYQIVTEVQDTAGNAAAEAQKSSALLDMDDIAPQVLSAALDLRNEGVAGKLLNRLTFGNFFNAEAVLTFTVQDPDAPSHAGLDYVELSMDQGRITRVLKLPAQVEGHDGDGLVTQYERTYQDTGEGMTEEVTEVTTEYLPMVRGAGEDTEQRMSYTLDGEGVLTLTCVLPVEELSAECWRREITVTAVDRLGNRAPVELKAADDRADGETGAVDEGELRSNLVHYETVAPQSQLRVAEADYADALYAAHTGAGTEYWFRDETLTVRVWDDGGSTEAERENSSGLRLFRVTDEAGHRDAASAWVNRSAPYVAVTNTVPVCADSEDLAADGMRPGKNVLTVYAQDNAGNDTRSTYTVYQDLSAPDCAISFEQEEQADKCWLRQGEGVTLTVRDDTDGESVNAGLGTVSFSLNGMNSVDDLSDSKQYVKAYTFPYDQLQTGKNVLTVTATDGVGQSCTKHWVIYKDTKTPVITGVTLKGLQAVRSHGNYTNMDVVLTVTVDDVQSSGGAKQTSGLRAAQLTYTGKRGYTKTLEGLKTCTAELDRAGAFTLRWTISAEEVMGTIGSLSFYLEDMAGNSATYSNLTDFGVVTASGERVESNLLTVENQAPTLGMSATKCAYQDSQSDPNGNRQQWYGGKDIELTYTMQDAKTPASGLCKAEVRVNGKSGTTAFTGKSAPVTGDSVTVELGSAQWSGAVRGGENKIQVTLFDDAGNKCERTDYIYLDLKSPKATHFAFEAENHNGGAEGNSVEVTDYGYFFSDETEVKVDVADEAASSGIAQVLLYRVGTDGKVTKCAPVKLDGKQSSADLKLKVVNTVSFTVPSGFKGQLYFCAVDHVGHYQMVGDKTFTGVDGKWRHPDGVRIETQNEHDGAEQHIKLEVLGKPETYLGKDNTNPLFKADAQVNVTVSDQMAGIKKIEYAITARSDTAKNQKGEWSVAYASQERKSGAAATVTAAVTDSSGWQATEGGRDENLYTALTKTFTVSHNSNDIVVQVKMTDNCDNVSEKQITLSIDKTAPQVSVSFTPDDSGDDTTWVGYFNTDRVMTLTVKERNFDPGRVQFTATKDGSPYGIGTSFDGGRQVVENGVEYRVYTMQHRFSAADSDFTFGVAVSDRAGNAVTDAQVNYGSPTARQVAKQFTIDQTPPVLNVELVGEEGEAGYFLDKVLVQITGSDRNFDRSRLDPTAVGYDPVTGRELEELPPFVLDGAEGVSGSFTFTAEGRYQLKSFTLTDKAGNVAACATPTFYVDTQAPLVEFFTDSTKATKLDQASTNDGAVPYFEATDANFASVEYTLTRYRRNGDMTESHPSVVSSISLGESVSFSDFPRLENEDDIYVLTAKVTDKAGREATYSAVFSVNRFGSTYMLDTATRALISKYYLNSEQPVTIVEINASEIHKRQVATSRNGETRVLVENADYTVTENPPIKNADKGFNTGSHWYEYTYTVSGSNYVQEGRYLTDVYSVDFGVNEQTNMTSKHEQNLFVDDYEEKKVKLYEGERANAPVEFIVDKTDPVLTLSEVPAHTRAAALDVTVNCADETALDRVDLYLNDVLVDSVNAALLDNGAYTYTVQERPGKQWFKAVAYDMAGNEIAQETGTFRVNTSLWAALAGNLPIIALIAVILLAAGVAVVLVVRRRREMYY